MSAAVRSTLVTAPFGFLIALLLAQVHATDGLAKHYGPGRMLQVYGKRVEQGLIDPKYSGFDGLASTPYCENIGRVMMSRFVIPKSGKWSPWQRFYIVDCSQPGADQARHIAERLTEYDYMTADKWGWAWDGTSGEGKTRSQTWIIP